MNNLNLQQKSIETNPEDSRKGELLYGNTAKFGIYQPKDYVKTPQNITILNNHESETHGIAPKRDDCELVYAGRASSHDTLVNLHQLTQKFQRSNPNCPIDYKNRSVSTGDIIVLNWRGNVSTYLVGKTEFTKIPNKAFFDKEITENNNPMIIPMYGKQIKSQINANASPIKTKANNSPEDDWSQEI
jgi:hypothetical protein